MGCNNQNKADGSATNTENVKKGKYALKSAVVEYKANMMNMETKVTTSFDDYGAKESSVTEMEMMGQSIKTVTLKKDSIMYTYNPDQKTGSKVSMKSNQADIDFENLTEAFQKEMHLEKVGEETFMDKPCIKYTIDSEQLKMKGSFLVWKGIALKTDVDMGGLKMVMTAVKIAENTDLPASTFDVPADIKFQ
jgi:hypothetical protein